eukprot:3150731-Alexandrium_andersonii.AAC.1
MSPHTSAGTCVPRSVHHNECADPCRRDAADSLPLCACALSQAVVLLVAAATTRAVYMDMAKDRAIG